MVNRSSADGQCIPRREDHRHSRVATGFSLQPEFATLSTAVLDSPAQVGLLPMSSGHQPESSETSHMTDYRALLAAFAQAIQDRVTAEQDLHREFGQGPDETEQQLALDVQAVESQRSSELEAVESEHQHTLAAIEGHHGPIIRAEESNHRARLHDIESQAQYDLATLAQQKSDSSWVVTSVLDDTAEDSPRRELERFKNTIQKLREEQVAEWTDIDLAFKQVQEERGWNGPAPTEPDSRPKGRDEAQVWFADRVQKARTRLRYLKSLILPYLFIGFRPLALFFALGLAVFVPVFFFVPPDTMGIEADQFSPPWIGAAAGVGAGGGLVLTLIVYTLSAMQQSDAFRSLQQATAEANWLHQIWLGVARDDLHAKQQECESRQRAMIREREDQLQRFEETHERKVREIEQRRAAEVREETERHAAASRRLQLDRQRAVNEALDTYQQARQITEQHWVAEALRNRQSLTEYRRERQRLQATGWATLKSKWEAAYTQFHADVAQLGEESAARFHAWAELVSNWQPSPTPPDFLRFGEYALNLDTWPGAVSPDMRLAPRVTEHQLPALLRFPEGASALFKMRDSSGREAAVAAIRSLTLRLLTLVPPGKIRFTILDPVGLGESFAGLMHLTDFDELMVSSRIWTEPGQIETKLADLTEHMENVLQKYLRNEFQTIEEYNAAAGEVAEPYHFLIISDFPNKFSDIAARRLVSIINSGPRCGVYTLMSLDVTKQMPHNFELRDIEPNMERFAWHDGAFHAEREDMSYWPITVDQPPNPEVFTKLVRKVGEASKDARRVEVAFSRIAPKAGQFWASDSRREIEVALGRAGATKLQQLKLGRGTSQHMLVAGKTGSGKSTFLHILITNLALHYSPDEVNFYLIDFKKGVEFKDYATLQLPHARVIAIESDREFGVSTLQKLDAVLQERGELFRKHGVQDIAGFRNANPQTPLPRILLIVDEFQEFFIEDDKLSQTASLMLDRLVRQGRAFGMHVILGSQTLGGAYSLARSTLGQVAVRVALQCSESDAHLILSEENTAARLLTRPGEAIYNDANGLSEGNHPFQIAWLEDDEREQALLQIRQQAQRRGLRYEAPIVFEGNIPSEISRNSGLDQVIDEFAGREKPINAPTVWLGDAVEINPPSAFTFHRQGGNHVLMVGQDAEAAQGIMSAALLSWSASATSAAAAPVAWLFDGSPADTLEADQWKSLLKSIPLPIKYITPRESAAALQELSSELAKRELDPDHLAPPILLLAFNLAKFRDLRKGEDEFGLGGFGSMDPEKPKDPGKLFTELLTKGPENGIHSMIWVDSYNNVDRWFSRQTLKELEQRIAFQMNANDSSSFIDSPLASRLGTHRALLYREETGTLEKFRPYGLPSADWLKDYHNRLTSHEEPQLATDLGEFNVL